MSEYDALMRARRASIEQAGPAAATSGRRGGAAPAAPPCLDTVGAETRAAPISPVILSGLVRFFEAAAITLLGVVIAFLYVAPAERPSDLHYILAALSGGLASAIAFQAFDLYGTAAFSDVWRRVPRLWLAWTAVAALLVAIAFFVKIGPQYSRVWFALWYVAVLVGLTGARIALSIAVRHWARQGRLGRRAVVFGAGREGEALIAALENEPHSDVQICGVFDDRAEGRVPATIAGHPRLGNIDALLEVCRKSRIDLLIVSLPITAETRLLQILKRLWVLPVDIRLSAYTSKLRFRPRAYSYIGNVPFIDLADKPIADWDRVLKWLFDKTVGSLALLLAAPVMAAIAIAIKLDSRGPVLFRQKRLGFNNEVIEVYKFRSMYVDKTDADAARLVTRDDPRVTRVGRFIRKTSLDELPQLFNVLKGDLSLVGPRPHALKAKAANQLYHDVVDGYFARHRVKPGITGWAQVNGWRGETDTEEKLRKRVEHDLYYIENWSVFLDLYILLKTPFALFSSENAY